MCCFSRKVKAVAETNIFARDAKDERQYLVYSMRFAAEEDLAMILPIPVPKDSKDDAVKFINLEKYAEFFADLRKGFPEPKAKGRGKGNTKSDKKADEAPKLEVVEVGSFQASFVPKVKDFERLDEGFRLPNDIWEKLPQYKDSGFAVFKLKKGSMKVHPMAFEFPRADAKKLFFPTVHIHDGKVHEKARFDHMLYCQLGDSHEEQLKWEESKRNAKMFMDLDKAQGLIEPKAHIFRKRMEGQLKNEDIFV